MSIGNAQVDTLFVYGSDTTIVEDTNPHLTYVDNLVSDTLLDTNILSETLCLFSTKPSSTLNFLNFWSIERNGDSLIVINRYWNGATDTSSVSKTYNFDTLTNNLIINFYIDNLCTGRFREGDSIKMKVFELNSASNEILIDSVNIVAPPNMINTLIPSDSLRFTINDGDVFHIRVASAIEVVDDFGVGINTIMLTDDNLFRTVNNISTKELSKVSEVNVYPNPFKDIITFDINTNIIDHTFKVVNIYGQILSQGDIENNRVNLSNLPSGTYILIVSGLEHNFTKQVVKY